MIKEYQVTIRWDSLLKNKRASRCSVTWLITTALGYVYLLGYNTAVNPGSNPGSPIFRKPFKVFQNLVYHGKNQERIKHSKVWNKVWFKSQVSSC